VQQRGRISIEKQSTVVTAQKSFADDGITTKASNNMNIRKSIPIATGKETKAQSGNQADGV
jgi:hypothetical protein